MAKKVKQEITQKPKRNRRGAAARRKGNAYEVQICKELNELGFNVETTRNNSKKQDNDKIDIYDKNDQLPCKIQLKKTQTIPQYFKIRSESTVDPSKFVIMWNKQVPKTTNVCSAGELVLMPKELFYELIKPYGNGEGKNNN